MLKNLPAKLEKKAFAETRKENFIFAMKDDFTMKKYLIITFLFLVISFGQMKAQEAKPIYNSGVCIDGQGRELGNKFTEMVHANVVEEKPDVGYEYEGSIKHQTRDISSCGIIGLKDSKIKNVTLENIEIVFSKGGDKHYAYIALTNRTKFPKCRRLILNFRSMKNFPHEAFCTSCRQPDDEKHQADGLKKGLLHGYRFG